MVTCRFPVNGATQLVPGGGPGIPAVDPRVTPLIYLAVQAIVLVRPNRHRVAVGTQRHRPAGEVTPRFPVNVVAQLDPCFGPDIPAVDPRVTPLIYLAVQATVPERPNRHRVAVRTQRHRTARVVIRRFPVDVDAQLDPCCGPGIPAVDPRVTRTPYVAVYRPNRHRVAVRTQRHRIARVVTYCFPRRCRRPVVATTADRPQACRAGRPF